MSNQLLRLRQVLPIAVALALADEICSLIPGEQAVRWSYGFQILGPVLGVLGCMWCARMVVGRARVLWILFAAGLACWTVGMVLATWEDEIQHLPFEIASLSDFAFLFYGVPILFALSTPVEGIQSSAFRWLDATQAVFAGYLAYVSIFAVLPFTSAPAEPLPTALVVLTYNIENVLLVVCCIARLLASRRGGDEWRFYRTLCTFLVTYGVGVGIYNHLAIVTAGKTTANLLVDGPYFLLAAITLTMPAVVRHAGVHEGVREGEWPATIDDRRSALALFVDNVSPILFTLALLALGAFVLRQHFRLGLLAICVAVAVYATRTTILQVRYRQAQLELQQARDTLEEISLQDSLTGLANRRCFDQTLDAEWSRAMRTKAPLSLLLIDVDHFKRINDQWGHPYGDRCLREIASALRLVASRSGDVVARYGGEEFAVILPVTSPAGAEVLATQMLKAVRALRIANETATGLFATISIGIAYFQAPQVSTPTLLVEASDRALYRAKQNGRNRVEHVPMQGLEPVVNPAMRAAHQDPLEALRSN